MNDTLADINSDKEIVLDITSFHNEEVLDKQSLPGCDHSKNHLNEGRNGVFTLNRRIKDKFISKMLLICLSGNLLRRKSHYCPKY